MKKLALLLLLPISIIAADRAYHHSIKKDDPKEQVKPQTNDYYTLAYGKPVDEKPWPPTSGPERKTNPAKDNFVNKLLNR